MQRDDFDMHTPWKLPWMRHIYSSHEHKSLDFGSPQTSPLYSLPPIYLETRQQKAPPVFKLSSAELQRGSYLRRRRGRMIIKV